MTRYHIVISGAIECYHVSDGGQYISTIGIRKHKLSADKFAGVLAKASKWFAAVATRSVKPNPSREQGVHCSRKGYRKAA
jgi:hypothetical protein